MDHINVLIDGINPVFKRVKTRNLGGKIPKFAVDSPCGCRLTIEINPMD
jgi:hypothetical protein